MEHPEYVGIYIGCCCGCPKDFGYSGDTYYDCTLNKECGKCWNREIPEKEEKEMATPRGTDSARTIMVIETKSIRGSGSSEKDMCRPVTQYWSLGGKLLAEDDPCKDGQAYKEEK